MKSLTYLLSLLAAVGVLLGATAAGADKQCGVPRSVACPAKCNAGEESDETQKCVKFDPEQYKKTGNGCVEYAPACSCKVPCPKMPEKLKLSTGLALLAGVR
jgi:hypothetical protein